MRSPNAVLRAANSARHSSSWRWSSAIVCWGSAGSSVVVAFRPPPRWGFRARSRAPGAFFTIDRSSASPPPLVDRSPPPYPSPIEGEGVFAPRRARRCIRQADPADRVTAARDRSDLPVWLPALPFFDSLPLDGGG